MSATTEYQAQRDALVAAIATVANVGRVHDRPRHGDFRTMWVATIEGIQQVRSWEISPGPVVVERREQGFRHRFRTWEIRGVVSMADMGSEDTADAPGDTEPEASFHILNQLAGEIADAVDTSRPAAVAAGTWIEMDPVETEIPQVVVIGGGAVAWGITLTMTGYTIVTP